MTTFFQNNLAYIIGAALGDGNLSNPNGRAVRLRISCDAKYPGIAQRIEDAIQVISPHNKVSRVHRKSTTCFDISCYSNKWETYLGWTAQGGSKNIQQVSVPIWIKVDKEFSRHCLRGLIETDGSIYNDRGYDMVNFVTITKSLAEDVLQMINGAGFLPKIYLLKTSHQPRYNIRISKSTREFIEYLDLKKD
ncbi:MAG: LAGLIDADG family homing endonuclease [Patescibacteria group bacterium]